MTIVFLKPFDVGVDILERSFSEVKEEYFCNLNGSSILAAKIAVPIAPAISIGCSPFICNSKPARYPAPAPIIK